MQPAGTQNAAQTPGLPGSDDTARDAIIRAEKIEKYYAQPSQNRIQVFSATDLSIVPGEIVALLGPSGSGKSTMLRMLSGLSKPSAGQVYWHEKPIGETEINVSIVFQSFALFPWLTVLENVEAPLQARGVPPEERRHRSLRMLDTVGLDGFESAYPKELSGGMRQRVGFARALVVNPDILLLDEPFSQLDVLTAETLRNDLLELWMRDRIPTKGILMVSHNIEEAVEMADRILIFSSDPGRISAELPVALGRPRAPESAPFRQIMDQVYTLLTTVPGQNGRRGAKPEPIGFGYRLPDAPVQQLSGLIDTLKEPPYSGRADLPQLADSENLVMDDLFPLIELLQLLGWALVSAGDIELTPSGRAYAAADMLTRKQMFADALMKHVPLAAHIRRVLDERPGHRAPAARFLRELEDHLSEEEAERVLDTVINWGRHAEIFAFDYDDEVLSLENF